MQVIEQNVPDEAGGLPAVSTLRRLGSSFGWFGFQRLFVMALGIATSGLLARQLGAEKMGILASAQALVGFVGILSMGIDPTVFTDCLHRHPERENGIMGGTTIILALSSVVAWLVLACYMLLFWQKDMVLLTTTLVCGLKLFISFPAPVAFWFQSRLLTRHIVVPNTIGTLVLRGWQWVTGLLHWGVPWVALGEVISLLYVMAASFGAYGKLGKRIRDWWCDWRSGWEVFIHSIPALVAGTLAVFLNRMDLIMLRWLSDEREVGFYAAASALTESLLFVGGISTSVLTPLLLQARGEDVAHYARTRQVHMRMNTLAGWLLAVVLSLTAGMAVSLVYGAEFARSGELLSLHAFLLVPCLAGSALQCHLSLERQLAQMTVALVLALGVNFSLNWLLIPQWAGMGAAASTLCATLVAHVLAPLLLPLTRAYGKEALAAVLWPVPNIRSLTALSLPSH
ncbi:MAG: flippase [Verrucomicrobiaceae bacterium]|nr:flippase [Verrucomicrobiaceae bacterium]